MTILGGGCSLVSSSAPSYDCRASTSDDNDLEDYERFVTEELNEKISRHVERRQRREQERMEFMESLLTNPNDPRPWETAGETVKRGGKWGKGKGKANQRPKKRVWNERRKEWLLNLPVCSGPQQSVRGAPRWAINVKTRCE